MNMHTYILSEVFNYYYQSLCDEVLLTILAPSLPILLVYLLACLPVKVSTPEGMCDAL